MSGGEGRIVVFVGPTLGGAETLCLCPSAVVRPPAERGDVLRAVLGGAQVIGLVDGYFERRLAVQHKEILWALAQGVRVYGAASMGALRAAEMDCFGMIGVGAVYQGFASGLFERDDEVAIAHGPGPDYRAASEALVNIRASISYAVSREVLSTDVAGALLATAQRLFYPDRTLERVVLETDLCDRQREELLCWFKTRDNRVNQKRRDAEELLALLHASGDAELSVPSVEYELPWTAAFEELWREVQGESDGPLELEQVESAHGGAPRILDL